MPAGRQGSAFFFLAAGVVIPSSQDGRCAARARRPPHGRPAAATRQGGATALSPGPADGGPERGHHGPPEGSAVSDRRPKPVLRSWPHHPTRGGGNHTKEAHHER